MTFQAESSELDPALSDLQDAFARVLAQIHVLRLAMGSVKDESDIRALMSQLGTIEEELTLSEGMIRRRSAAH